MQNVLRYRAMGRLCRQQAVLHPEASWHWLAQAERWEDLAETEIALLFRVCHSIAGPEPKAVALAGSEAA